MSQEELAFRRQIEDLFELLEMEKAADKNDGVRVYQTDSSRERVTILHSENVNYDMITIVSVADN